ncbi:MAG: cellulose synthase catalytic subunit [Thermoanaerobaculia bacterium]|nr:cellulose synthase catalytic subunit [Thermoanaerobaculia bacterium]
MDTYFQRFEDRQPPPPVPYSATREAAWQFLATLSLCFGAWYLYWRWTSSLNPDALWLAIPVVAAETCAYIGLMLFTYNLWYLDDRKVDPPPETIRDCGTGADIPDRPISVDVFFPTYDEDPELVRLSVLDAKKLTYPHPIDIRIHVLDDGRRESMRQLADEEGVSYFDRPNNVGFKAGNMRHAMERTHGDFILICDADTRPFPQFLERTLGYFRDADMAWVQTPQWFFDLPEGERLPAILSRFIGRPGSWIGRGIEGLFGPVVIGEDPFANDPQMFYDVILRRRNRANAAFCCGAGSIHRREAVMQVALRSYVEAVEEKGKRISESIEDEELRAQVDLTRLAVLEREFTPFRFHVSEDLYTSIYLHSDRERNWKSVQHSEVLSKMLSPQDLQSWTVQRFKYAGGTLDIFLHDNPLFRKGLSLPQRLMYGMTFWSYLGVLWNIVFLLAPLVYLFSGIAPVAAYSADFFLHILPFLILNELAFMVGTWGVHTYKGKVSYLAFFPVNLRALWTVLRGQKIKFPTTPKERQSGNFFHLVLPQFLVMVLTVVGLVLAIVLFGLGLGTFTLGGIIANSFWALNNMAAMARLVGAAFWRPREPALQTTSTPVGSPAT